MTLTILYIILSAIFGILCYFGYIIYKQRREIDRLWVQIVTLASATSKRILETEKKIKNNDKE
jgi:hypothetical protein